MAEKKTEKKELTVQEKSTKLLGAVNEIDANTIAEASPHFEEAWKVEKRGMWMKGRAVLEAFPELEERALAGSGRPSKEKVSEITFTDLEEVLGRSRQTIVAWVKLVLEHGKTKKDFEAWLRNAVRPEIEKFQRKLIATDGERKEPEPDVKKAIEDQTFLAVAERANAGEYTDEDVKWLVMQHRHMLSVMRKVLQFLLDDQKDKAIKEIEAVVEEK